MPLLQQPLPMSILGKCNGYQETWRNGPNIRSTREREKKNLLFVMFSTAKKKNEELIQFADKRIQMKALANLTRIIK